MTFNWDDILRSKQEYWQRLAALPIAEKLRLLDQLRRRAVTIAACRLSPARPKPDVPHEAEPSETQRCASGTSRHG